MVALVVYAGAFRPRLPVPFAPSSGTGKSAPRPLPSTILMPSRPREEAVLEILEKAHAEAASAARRPQSPEGRK